MCTRKSFFIFSALITVFMLGSGWIYQQSASYLDALSNIKVMPTIPLEQFPLDIGSWQGSTVAISETVLKVAANDDYISRTYTDSDRRLSAMIYVAYTAEPRRMLGHRPRVCYPGSGWIHDGTEESLITTLDREEIPVLVHRFHHSGLDYREVVVVNYYVVNGTVTNDHTSFSGLRFRRPKITNGQPEYVAQIQISSNSELAAKRLAEELSDEILHYLPSAP